eukprot:CAMPEP_0115627006 /NCGR_PEP_ID=MMETSP0272-20121206/28641_1 /TAXON_ID=71861 /ORGANISM="Scrippsiella trochoidea, Strain CCMP3099" /LENGTH=218 /DNA_ID=CAMNT_0003063387 /DNA_START=621 /DNA_END=1277 /DNA_ORIENTATION=-
MSAKTFLLIAPHHPASKPKDKKLIKYAATWLEPSPRPMGLGRRKKMSPKKGMPLATEKLASAGGPWSGNLRATKFSSTPMRRLQTATPQLKPAKIVAACSCVKHDSSSHCVMNGKTVHGAEPGAPWQMISTKVGYLKSDHTFGKLFTKTEAKPWCFLLSASSAAFGSSTMSMIAAPTRTLNAATPAILILHPSTPKTMVAAYAVATWVKTELQTAPVK